MNVNNLTNVKIIRDKITYLYTEINKVTDTDISTEVNNENKAANIKLLFSNERLNITNNASLTIFNDTVYERVFAYVNSAVITAISSDTSTVTPTYTQALCKSVMGCNIDLTDDFARATAYEIKIKESLFFIEAFGINKFLENEVNRMTANAKIATRYYPFDEYKCNDVAMTTEFFIHDFYIFLIKQAKKAIDKQYDIKIAAVKASIIATKYSTYNVDNVYVGAYGDYKNKQPGYKLSGEKKVVAANTYNIVHNIIQYIIFNIKPNQEYLPDTDNVLLSNIYNEFRDEIILYMKVIKDDNLITTQAFTLINAVLFKDELSIIV